MKVALIQSTVLKSNDENIENALKRIKEAAKNGADVAILPEMFCCPYSNNAFPSFAQPEGGKNYLALSKCACDNNIYLIAGSMPEKDGDNIYNTSYIFNRQGEKIAKHRKIQLFDINVTNGQQFKESDTLSSGDEIAVFDTEFGKLCVLICFDIRFPELSRLAALKGARCIIIPAAFNMTTGPCHWELLFKARALDNQLFTIGVSPARNVNSSYIAYAHSLIVSPWGEILAMLDEKDDTLYYDIDLSQNESVRQQIPQLLNRRDDLYSINFKNETY